jgi:hypothetical protein
MPVHAAARWYSWTLNLARLRRMKESDEFEPYGEAGRASGPSTTALPAAMASSFTGDLRAARCVARDAGSVLGGGPLPMRSTTLA